MKLTAIGADISINDVSCSCSLIQNIENDISQLLDVGAYKAALTNITGDDVVISAFVEDDKLESVNSKVIDILRKNAESLGDIGGISKTPEGAGEGISYAEAKIREDRYPDAVIIAFDTYGGEEIVGKVADSVIKAAKGMDDVTDIGGGGVTGTLKIPGVGYISDQTDDPVVVATIENIESVGTVAGAMVGAAVGNQHVNLVRRGTPSYVIPRGVIMSVTAFMNGNVMDLAVPLFERMRISGE
ncbi:MULTISPECIES: hypothetical protein [Methanobacterium]|uniref:Uncharacterized protein n=1 Tax=Methanobacterium bryantii TaxID=2161 RepID=A0A2A2H2C9_METBR|nr:MULTISPECIES: hypothetical protein [Methanobacterium]OEC88138.1 hypothetical protein A9507_06155 [Methanobacterium sp. A39]PAV03542.1 hypothetical protein ASJ80_00890 [Methanobacterium bryantii]